MAEPIVGTPSIVGFGSDYRSNDLGLGLAAFLLNQSIERGICEVTRDINKGIGDNHVAIVEQGMANALATEKIGAAAILATEKIGAAAQAAIAASNLENAKNTAEIRAAIAECCCTTQRLIEAKAYETNQLIRQIDTDNAKLALQNAQAELLAIKYSKQTGN